MKETVLWRRLRLAVRNVTADRRKMMQWMRSMAKGGVRPCHLRDILEDMILEED